MRVLISRMGFRSLAFLWLLALPFLGPIDVAVVIALTYFAIIAASATIGLFRSSRSRADVSDQSRYGSRLWANIIRRLGNDRLWVIAGLVIAIWLGGIVGVAIFGLLLVVFQKVNYGKTNAEVEREERYGSRRRSRPWKRIGRDIERKRSDSAPNIFDGQPRSLAPLVIIGVVFVLVIWTWNW